MNDLLDQEIHDLRFWGVKVRITWLMKTACITAPKKCGRKCADPAYQASHLCNYSYMPQWLGTSRDGKNAMQPDQQASEFLDSLSTPLQKCLLPTA